MTPFLLQGLLHRTHPFAIIRDTAPFYKWLAKANFSVDNAVSHD